MQRKHSIIGTAGHVDHGKTLLIKALTGIDTDRLIEEKKRGITIELGFAYLDLPGGGRAGIIDVPGHERFIKNMLAGVGGMDLVLLVVAADEGFMPQTIEHLGILSLLDIPSGFIVLTKSDLAEPDWIDMVEEEAKERVSGTFLEGAPVYRVSAATGEGIPALQNAIFEALDGVREKNAALPFRIPIDRVFSVDGFGTVITGTLVEGSLKEGEEIAIYPGGMLTRARNLQVHGEDAERAFAGQRVAVNLAGVKKTEVDRGDVLAPPGALKPTRMLDVKARILSGCPREIRSGSRLHFYHGARDALCKIVLLEGDVLHAGEEGFAQLRFTEPVAVKAGDRFVLRFYSPVETVGGGTILSEQPAKHRRHDDAVLERLAAKESGSLEDKALALFYEGSAHFAPRRDVQTALALSDGDFAALRDGFVASGAIDPLTDDVDIHSAYAGQLWDKLRALLEAHHAAQPLQSGLRVDELRAHFLPRAEAAERLAVLALFARQEKIRLENGRVALAGFTVQYDEKKAAIAAKIETCYLEGAFEPPTTQDVLDLFPKQAKDAKQVLDAFVEDGKLLPLAPQIHMHRDAFERAIALLQAHVAAHGSITLAEFRDALGTSRKYAVALLEYLDRKRVTKKLGDARTLANPKG